ncbi:hypothetical protein Bca4012_013510 [Brassica carinata]
MTLLLGPPSCGKTTLLLALAGRLDPSLKTTGNVSYILSEFVPEKTSNYASQNNLHIPEITEYMAPGAQGLFTQAGFIYSSQDDGQQNPFIPSEATTRGGFI